MPRGGPLWDARQWTVCPFFMPFVFWVQLADFGLSRVSNSHWNSSGTTTEDQAGTLVFTPPEAFDLSYKPVRSYDIYRFILDAFHVARIEPFS